MKDERLLVLLDAYLDETLSLEEKCELEQMLLGSASARQEFWRRASLHGWTYEAAKLKFAVRIEIPPLPAENLIPDTAYEVPAPRLALRGVARCPHCGKATARGEAHWHWDDASGLLALLAERWRLWRSSMRGARAGWAAMAGMAILMVALFATGHFPGQKQFAEALSGRSAAAVGVGTLVHAAGVQWEGAPEGLRADGRLAPGWLRLKSGAVMVQFNNGTRAVLEGPAEFAIIGEKETFLRSGRLSVTVSRQGRGFSVGSSAFTLVDLGTEFGVDVPREGAPEVHVFDGEVEVAYGGEDRQKTRLREGRAVRLAGTGAAEIASSRAAFLSQRELESRERAELRELRSRWMEAARALQNDPAMLVHFNFEDQRSPDRTLVNRARMPAQGTHGNIIGCEWVNGRWPGKGALHFRDPEDRVRLSVNNQFRSVTYLAWVSPESLSNRFNALALTQRARPGEVHWQIDNQGRVELTVLYRDATNGSGWERLLTRPVVTPDRLNQWIHLAAVYDGLGRTMSLYVDGQVVATKPVEHLMMLNLGTVELGNWTPRGDIRNRERWLESQGQDYVIRDFRGKIDEFALLARALSADEIRRHHRAGLPREVLMLAAGDRPGQPARPQ